MRYTVFLVLSLTDKHKLLHFTTDEREFQICTYENHILNKKYRHYTRICCITKQDAKNRQNSKFKQGN